MANHTNSISQFQFTFLTPLKMPSKVKAYLLLVLLLFFLLGFMVARSFPKIGLQTGTQAQGEKTAPNIGDKAPDFTLASFSGENISLSSLQGKPVVLLFWATWCSSCLENLKNAQNIHQELQDKVVFLGIHRSDTESTARSKLITQRFSITFSLLMDGERRVFDSYKLNPTSMPIIYFIDKNGVVAARLVGLVSSELIRNTVQELIK